MNSRYLYLKILISLLIILFMVGCGNSPEYTIVKGKVLASDNQPLLKADVSLNYTTGGKPIKTVEVGKDGNYQIQIKEEGIFALTFSGVNHTSLSVPILNDKKEVIELNVKLQKYNYADKFEDVNIIGDFNNFNFRTAKRMTKQDNGTFTAEINTDKDSLAYQLLGAEKTGRSINGTQTDEYVYDGGGDYRSVVAVKGGKVKIVFDPSKITRDDSKPETVFKNDERQAKLYSLKKELDSREQIYRQESAKNPGVKPNIDFTNKFSEIKRQIESAKDHFERNLQYVNYLHLANLTGNIPDKEIVSKAFIEIEPSSYLWSIDPTILDLTLQQNEKNKYDFVDKVINQNKDDGVVAYLLYIKMDEAQSTGNIKDAKLYHDKLINKFADTPFGKYAKKVVIDDKIIAGKPIPSFAVKSLTDPKQIFSDKNMKGKVYLVDFWATWCHPCIGEMPYLHEAYKKYHDKGFDIISLSFDQQQTDIDKFRNNKWKMPWEHSFVVDGFNSDLAKEFQVDGIPKPILVDKNGNIIATQNQVRGQNLLDELDRIFAN